MWIGDVRLKRSLSVKLARLLQDIVGHEVNQSVLHFNMTIEADIIARNTRIDK